jgi:superfamily II DNA or RNA helicase
MNNNVNITIINEYNAIISGLSRDHYDYFYNKYGIFVDKYNFSPLYKLGRWDGKKRFFSKNGLVPVNLLNEVVETLENIGYKNFSLVDKRVELELSFENIDKDYFTESGITLGEHQVGSINAILENFGGIIRGGTGAGKTIITAALSDIFNKSNLKCLVIVPNYDLVVQTIKTFNKCLVDVGEYSGKKKDPNHLNVISTWQALNNNKDVIKMFDVVFLDECHTISGQTISEIISENCNHMPIKVAMTGTLPKHPCNAMTLKCCFGDVVYEVTASELIDKGWLANIEILCMELSEDFTNEYNIFKKNNPDAKDITYKQFFNGYFPDYSSEMSYLTKSMNRNEFIIDFIKDIKQENGNTLVILNSIKHGKYLESMIPNSVFVYGTTKNKDRQKIYDSYKDKNDIIHISTYKLVQAGLDIPRIKNLVILDAGTSYTRVIQSLGRGLRKADDKDMINVFDIHSNCKYSIKHFKSRTRFYKEEKYSFSKMKVPIKKDSSISKIEIEDVDFN